MHLYVIDGQGGSLGKGLTAELKKAFPDLPLTAIGTNAIAAAAMLSAGADRAATGENPVIFCCGRAEADDFIIGPIGIITANAFLGEITPAMAEAAASSRAHKLLIPSGKCGVTVIGTQDCTYADYIRQTVSLISASIKKESK